MTEQRSGDGGRRLCINCFSNRVGGVVESSAPRSAIPIAPADFPCYACRWVNKDGETRASYDIIVTDLNKALHTTTFIEVKSTRYAEKNVFPLSLLEWEFASKPGIKYSVYRVFCAGDPERVHVRIVHDVHRMVAEGNIQLCLAI